MITFDAPIVVALAPVVGAAVWAAAAWARRSRVRRAAAWSEVTARIARSAGKRGAPALGLAAGLAAVALSGPRWGEEQIVTETRGLNVVLAIDISRSMLAEDAKPSRLGRALREARRLVQDLDGDRLGLEAFAGTSYILSPLSVDGSAITLYLDALDPDVASEGGTSLAPALAQGIDLLRASPEIADRVLVLFTDGEGHDSLEQAVQEARRLAGLGIHLILVAEGGREPTRIPVRDDRGTLVAWQQDQAGTTIVTNRHDDVLGALADAAQGTIVAAELPDQAGAVRDLVASYKRATATENRTQRGRPRAWIPLLLAGLVLAAQTFTRRTAALIAVLVCLLPRVGAAQTPRLRSGAEKAWDRGDARGAAAGYLAELKAHNDDDTAWYNTGTAALAAGDVALARTSLAHASSSVDPELRFRALYNLGLLGLLEAKADSTNREAHLADAERAYREALLLKPNHLRAKWNLELVNRMRGGGGQTNKPNPPPPPSSGGGGASQQPPPPQGAGGGGGGMSESQADQVLRSIGQEELRTKRDHTGRTRRAAPAGVKDW